MKVLHVCMFVTVMALFGGTAFSYEYAGDQIDCSVDGEPVFSFDVSRSGSEQVTLDCGMDVTCRFQPQRTGGSRPDMPAKLRCSFRQGRSIYLGKGAEFYETSDGLKGSLELSINIPDHNHVLNCQPAS